MSAVLQQSAISVERVVVRAIAADLRHSREKTLMLQQLLLPAFAVPLATALLLLAAMAGLLRAIGGGAASPPAAHLAGAGAWFAAAPFAAAFLTLERRVPWPPRETLHWLPWLAISAATLWLVSWRRFGPAPPTLETTPLSMRGPALPGLSFLGLAVFGLATLALTIRPLALNQWSSAEVWAVAGLGSSLVVTLAGLLAFNTRPDRSAGFAAAITFAATLPPMVLGTVVLLLGSSARLSQLGSATAVGVCTLVGASVFLPRLRAFAPSSAWASWLILLGLVANGWLYSRLSWIAALLLLAAGPLGLEVGRQLTNRSSSSSSSRHLAAVLITVVVLVLAATGLQTVLWLEWQSSDPYSGY